MLQNHLEEAAKDLVGTPYKHLGRDPKEGLDCWGLVIAFYKKLGIQLADPVGKYTKDWFSDADYIDENKGVYFERRDELPIAGDLVAMRVRSPVVNHLAIVLNRSGDVLNTDERIGVHRSRLFILKEYLAYYLRLKQLLVRQ